MCEVCSTVIEVPDTLFASLAERLKSDYGFAIRPRHFALLGRCADCATS